MRLFVISLAAIGVFAGHCLHAAVVISPELTFRDSVYSYNYTVTNTELQAVLGLEMIIAAEPVSTIAPTGWFTIHVRFEDRFLVQWIADVRALAAVHLAPGQSMNGFIVESSSGPGPEPVAFRAFDMNLQSISGTTTGPHPTPEPATVLLMLVGLVGLVLLGHKTAAIKRVSPFKVQ